jgi:transcriptional regulator GlxA family with amidase domain
MTKIAYILPMSAQPRTPRRIVFVAYPGFELIDLSGPSSVFSTANRLARTDLYRIVVASPHGGAIATSCGPDIATTACKKLRISKADTVLAMGAYAKPLIEAMASPAIASVLRRASSRAERYGSVCAGTFLLAAAGLLPGRRVATHWRGCEPLRQQCPDAVVEAEALYIADERLWTSAGGTTGIDMALAMLERDHGKALMGAVARQLVVYAHRPGHQSQFSSVLEAQVAADGAFADLIAWLQSNLDASVKVAQMAARAGMSERNFYRRFTAVIGIGPSKYLERMRLDAAKQRLESGEAVKTVAARIGFKSESAFRSAFAERFGVTPAHHQRMQRAALHPRETGR